MPTHKDLPEGFHEAAERRSREAYEATLRAAQQRKATYAARLAAADEARAATSVPPPPTAPR